MKKLEQLEGELSQKASLKATWKSFLEHPGWALLEAGLKEQRAGRLLVLAEPCTTFGSVLPQEFMKGEGSGLGLAMNFPRLQIELLESEVKRLETTIELEEANESAEKASVLSRGRVESSDWHGGSGLESSPSGDTPGSGGDTSS